MKRQPTLAQATSLVLLCWGGFHAGAALAQDTAPATPAPAAASGPPTMQALGRDRYRIGSILVDKKARRLTVGGRLLGADRPLEYFAVMRGGYKSYESLVEIDSTGSEFNLACILLGLDAALAKRPEYQFSAEPLVGQRARIELAWAVGGKRFRSTPLQMLLTDAQRQVEKRDEWVYIGSTMLNPSTFGADSSGSLIGFVHDPTSIFEHVAGLGIGSYGSVAGNRAILPPPDTRLELTVMVLNEGKPL